MNEIKEPESAPPVFLVLEINSETPLYQQIRDQVVVAIAEGKIPDGAALPTTRQLALDFGINFHTVNKAYDVLRQEGFVQLTRKQGTFIHLTPEPEPAFLSSWQARLHVLLAEAAARGLDARTILERCQTSLTAFPQTQRTLPPHA